MNSPDWNTERKEFDEFISAIGSEIEQAQVKLISAANIQMLLHYWKIGNFILYRRPFVKNILKRRVILQETLNTCANLPDYIL